MAVGDTLWVRLGVTVLLDVADALGVSVLLPLGEPL